jgi:hypothetical protein
MAASRNGVILSLVMNSLHPLPVNPVSAPADGPRLLRGVYASLEQLINTASFESGDFTDTVFISLHEQRDREAEQLNY